MKIAHYFICYLLLNIATPSFCQVFNDAASHHLLQVKELRENRDYDSAFWMLENHIFPKTQSLPDTLLIQAFSEKGVIYYQHLKQYEKARDAYLKSISIHQSYPNYRQYYYAYTLKSLGMTYRKLTKYDSALNNFLQSVKLLEEDNPDHYALQAECNSYIGNIYRKTSQDSLSANYQSKSIQFWEKTTPPNPRGLAMAYHNLGLSERKLGQYTKSLGSLKESLAIKKQHNLQKQIPKTLSGIGDVFYQKQEYDSALYYYNLAFPLRDPLLDREGKAITMNNWASTYLALNQLEDAKKMLDTLSLFIDRTEPNTIKEYHLTFSTYYFAVRNMPLGQKHLDQYQAYQTKIYNEEMTNRLADARTKYHTEEVEENNRLIKEQAEIKQRIIYLLTTIALITLIAGVIFAMQKRKIAKQKKHIEILMQELSHRIKNNFAIFKGMLSFQQSRSKASQIQDAIEDIKNRLQSMSIIHKKLYQGSQPDRIQIDVYVKDLVENLVFTSRHINLKPDFKLTNIELPANQALSIGFLVNELVTNALKYAFEGISTPKLGISMQQQQDQYLVQIQDNGIGFDINKKKTDGGEGSKLIRNFIKQLKGNHHYTITSDGTKFELTFPRS